MMKLVSWAEKMVDLVLLNILWIVCSIPIVTMGAATVAMHYVIQKMAAGEVYHLWDDFWKGFRQNWKQGTAAEAVLLLMAAVAVADFRIGTNLPGTIGMVCQFIGVLLILVWLAIEVMIFPLLARYQNSFGNSMKNALVLGFTNPHIYLVNIGFLAFWPVLIWFKDTLFLLALFLILLIYVAAETYVRHLLLQPVYKRLLH
ncbi:MAG: YesL family protein [Lachnospiraceae bacterium]